MTKKIVFIGEGHGIGGAERSLVTYLKYLDKDRFKPLVILTCDDKLNKYMKHLNIDTKVMKNPRFLPTSFEFGRYRILNPFFVIYDLLVILAKVIKIANFLGKIEVSIIHTNGLFEHIYGGMAAKIVGVPCIWHIHGIPSRMGRPFLNLLTRYIPTKVIVISKSVENVFRGAVKKKIILIYHGLNVNRFNAKEANESNEIRRHWNFKDSDTIIGMVGRVVPWKGHKDFIKAAKTVSETNPNVKFIIVGGTIFGRKSHLIELKRLAKRLDIENKIIFTGFIDNVEEILSIIDIFVHCSVRPEPFGLGIIEAMAFSKAVITTDIGAPREIIDDNINGILVRPNDPHSLSKAIKGLLDSPERRIKLGSAARKKAETHFNIERVISELSGLYDSIFDNLSSGNR